MTNYADRFVYGEDMISSGKWGKEITSEIGKTSVIQGVRSGESIDMLPRVEVLKRMEMLRSGDLIFFIKAPHTKSFRGDSGAYRYHNKIRSQ